MHRYYPAGVDPEKSREAYLASPEWQRFCEKWERVMRLEVLPRWDEFHAVLKEALPGCTFWDTTHPRKDGCRRLRIYPQLHGTLPDPPEDIAIVALVSFLAPVYSLYEAYFHRRAEGTYVLAEIRHQSSDRTAPYARVLTEHIEQYFDCCLMPPEVGHIRVPDVCALGNVPLGQQTLFELLLTEDIQ